MSPPRRITRATKKRFLRKQETSKEILRKQNVTRKKQKKLLGKNNVEDE